MGPGSPQTCSLGERWGKAQAGSGSPPCLFPCVLTWLRESDKSDSVLNGGNWVGGCH